LETVGRTPREAAKARSQARETNRQVTDIPKVTRIVEHRLHRKRCGCGGGMSRPAPASSGVDRPGPPRPEHPGVGVLSRRCFQHVLVERAAMLIADVTRAYPSTGWVGDTQGRRDARRRPPPPRGYQDTGQVSQAIPLAGAGRCPSGTPAGSVIPLHPPTNKSASDETDSCHYGTNYGCC